MLRLKKIVVDLERTLSGSHVVVGAERYFTILFWWIIRVLVIQEPASPEIRKMKGERFAVGGPWCVVEHTHV